MIRITTRIASFAGLMICFSINALSEELSDAWVFYEGQNSSYSHWYTPEHNELETIFEAGRMIDFYTQEGRYKAYLDSTNWEHQWELHRSDNILHKVRIFDTDRWRYKKTTGYLVQTVSAQQFTGKHLHFSGFVKTEKSNFSRIIGKFRKQVEEDLIDKVQQTSGRLVSAEDVSTLVDTAAANVEKHLKDLSENIVFGIAVFLRFPEAILRQDMTQSEEEAHSDWGRLNVEVGIPVNCKYISLVFWT